MDCYLGMKLTAFEINTELIPPDHTSPHVIAAYDRGLDYICPQTVSLVEAATYPLELGETHAAPVAGNDCASDSELESAVTTEVKEVVRFEQ